MENDPNNSSQYVIKNESDESMKGIFSLYYDAVDGNRKLVNGVDFSRVNNFDIEPKKSSNPITFTEPTDAKEKGKYILVFQGTFGNEQGAVVGRVVNIRLCDERNTAIITISGTDDASVGKIYTASGGSPPYTYSISCGSINQFTGQVTNIIGCCPSVTITATDSCGKQGSKTARGGGLWFYVGQQIDYCFDKYRCPFVMILGGDPYLRFTGYEGIGDTQFIEYEVGCAILEERTYDGFCNPRSLHTYQTYPSPPSYIVSLLNCGAYDDSGVCTPDPCCVNKSNPAQDRIGMVIYFIVLVMV